MPSNRLASRLSSKLFLLVFLIFFSLNNSVWSYELQGRVIDRSSISTPDHDLKSDKGTDLNSFRGILGVKVTVFDGKKNIATQMTDEKGFYQFKRLNVNHCRVVYSSKKYYPNSIRRSYTLVENGLRNIYLDPGFNPENRSPSHKKNEIKTLGNYHQVASGLLALSHQQDFFREDVEDSTLNLSAFFDPNDSSDQFPCLFGEMLWAEFLSQERPLETRYYLAAALSPLLDSLHWGPFQGMEPYLNVSIEALQKTSSAMHEAMHNPKKLPNPADIRKCGLAVNLASQLANEYLADPALSESAKDRFLAQWKKSWGKDAPTFQEDAESPNFDLAKIIAKLAREKSDLAEAQYLLGRGLFAEKKYGKAIEALHAAIRLEQNQTAQFLEAEAYFRLKKNNEAKSRFNVLAENGSPNWKSQSYRSLAKIAEQEKQNAEAVDLYWKAEKALPNLENIYRLAEISLKIKDHDEIETKLAALADQKENADIRYWLGRYAEENQQGGVAEDHYRKAWALSPKVEYAEALGRIYMGRDNYIGALDILSQVTSGLTPVGLHAYAQCLLQLGRVQEAGKVYREAYTAHPSPELLLGLVESLIQGSRYHEALILAQGYPDQSPLPIRIALVKASIANHDADKAKPILQDLLKKDESNPDYHCLLGLVYYEVGKVDKAGDEFDKALRYRQDFSEATYYAGMAFLKLGKPDVAKGLFNELTQKTSPEWKTKGLMGMGRVFNAQQKPEAAESYYQRSIDVQETAEAEALLALSRRRLGGPEKWVALANKAYSLDENHPLAVKVMGECLWAQNKKNQAIELLKKNLEANPNACEPLIALSKFHYMMNAFSPAQGISARATEHCAQDPESFFYAGLIENKMQNHDAAVADFKSFKKAGGDKGLIPEEYR